MFLYKSSLIRIFAAAVGVSSCNEASFHPERIPSRTLPASADVEKAPEPAPDPSPSPSPTPTDVLLPAVQPVLDIAPTDEDMPPAVKEPVIRRETLQFDESFTQEGLAGSADIAIVVDDSGSMDLEQENLSTKLSDLLVSLKDANWQIGVVTTSPKVENGKDVCQLKLIKSTDSDGEAKFLEAVKPGIKGLSEEQGIRQAVNALQCPETPWVRPDSTVAVLIVSDEDNCSNNGLDCGDKPWATEQYLIDYVEKDLKRVVGKNAGFYGIIAPEKKDCPTANNESIQYRKLINYKSGGNVNYGNICDASYKGTLERISKNIAKLLSSQFVLKKVPDLGSASLMGVKANGDPLSVDDYSISGNTLTFKIGGEPALGSQITISYKVTVITTE
ncbi:MAG: VWA domain-containing protein [Proteobacteria bacterium]|nr:MAG: VWA domain-containing protein [Pseudomonadota bacterium]